MNCNNIKELYDKKQYLECYKHIKKTNNLDNQVIFALLNLYGYGCKKNYDLAYNILKTQSLNGNKEAYYYLAECLKNGLGIQKDIEQAYLWYKNSYLFTSNLDALFEMAMIIESKDEKKFVTYLTKLASYNHENSLMELVKYYKYKDKQQYLFFLNQLNKTNNIYSYLEYFQYFLYESYNYEKVQFYLNYLVENNNYEGYYLYGEYLLKSLNNKENAYEYLNISYKNGIKSAGLYLAICYYYGYGVEINRLKSLNILSEILKDNDIEIYSFLSHIFSDTENDFYDIKTSLFYLKKAADLNDNPSIKKLAYHYLSIKDYDNAYKYYNLSKQLDDKTSKCNVKKFYKNIFTNKYRLKPFKKIKGEEYVKNWMSFIN